MDNYDEDLNENPFLQSLLNSYADLFNRCISEQWLIAIPRRDCLPKYTFSLEDFTHHVLKPIAKDDELQRIRRESGDSAEPEDITRPASSNGSITNEKDPNGSFVSTSSSSGNGSVGSFITPATSPASSLTSHNNTKRGLGNNWNYKTLSQINVEYVGTTLIVDTDASSLLVQRRIEVLFEETFYTADKRKYKLLCINCPLIPSAINQKLDGNGSSLNENSSCPSSSSQNSSLGLWNLTSLRDSIDFLWVKGHPKLLETYDSYIRAFLQNHSSMETLPIAVQRDVVLTLYLKCLNYGIQCIPNPDSNNTPTSSSSSSSKSKNSKGTDDSKTLPPYISEFLLQRFRLATESYVLNGVYRTLISAVTSAITVSTQDAHLNKVIKNLSNIHPQDLEIHSSHWNNLSRAKQEMGRINLYSSALGKLQCLKKVIRYLRPDPAFDNEEYETISTDELIPICVYLIIKNPIGNWMAQLQFLRQFRFSTIDQKDNENSFYIATLDASLEHLKSGKVLGGDIIDSGGGIPTGLGEAWLRALHQESLGSPLGEMFDVIRLGNCARLKELIEDYELCREDHIVEKQEQDKMKKKKPSIDASMFCHPLCDCQKCLLLLQPLQEIEVVIPEPAIRLCTTEDCLTLLHVACIYGRPIVVDYLLTLNPPFDVQDVQGMTALHYCASRGHQNALLLLLHAGASMNIVNNEGNSVLHLSSENGHEGCVKALIYYAEHARKHLNVSCQNYKMDTPLHFASRWGYLRIVQILVEHGASISAENCRHATPLDCAHDIHIQKLLQRSLRRRSLMHENHGDFINIEVFQKDHCSPDEGVVMVISEPKEDENRQDEELREEGQEFKGLNNNSCTSANIPIINVEGDNITLGDVSRIEQNISANNSRNGSRRSSIVGTFGRGRRNSIAGLAPPISNEKRTSRRSMIYTHYGENVESIPEDRVVVQIQTLEKTKEECPCHPDFVHNSNSSLNEINEPDHIRRFSVESLDAAQKAVKAMTFSGVKRAIEDHDIKKLFNAIIASDIPLALFYLGIPPEELNSSENYSRPLQRVPTCHPLCPCTRCIAKLGGLGVSIDILNDEGMTPLMLAVQYNLQILVRILVRFGADLNIQSKCCAGIKTALDYAHDKDFDEIIDILETSGACSSNSFSPVYCCEK